MATVNGLTAEYMEEIVDSVVVGGVVVGDNLVLEHHDGSTTDAGNVRGPAGEDGVGGGGFEMSQTFAVPSSTWNFVHNQGTRAVHIYTEDTGGHELVGDISYPDDNTARVTFYQPQAGSGRVWT